jgi:hypothetical protein
MSQSIFERFAADAIGSMSTDGDKPSAGAAAPRSPANARVGQFVDQYLPLAQKVGSDIGVSPEVLLGQWGLETGWGRSVIPGTNNLGNIKDFSGRGAMATDNMTGSRDAYRQYASPDEFGDDLAKLLRRRYASALQSGGDAQKFFSALKQGGYAEDPDYVKKGLTASGMVASYIGGQPAAAPERQPYYSPANKDLVGPGAPKQDAGVSDYLKQFAAAGIEALGAGGQFLGEGAAYVANKLTGTEDYEGKNLLGSTASAIRDSMSEGGKQALAASEIKGDISDLSSIELPDSAEGWGMLISGGLGSVAASFLPLVGQAGRVQRLAAAGKTAEAAKAASALRNTAIVTGGAMTGGSAAEEVRTTAAQAISGMTHEQLMAEVPAYAQSFAQSGSEQQARQAVVNYAARTAGLAASAFGAAGGAINAKVIEDIILKKGVSSMLGKAGGGLAGRTALGTGGGVITESGQETSEKVGQNIGENVALGRPALQDATRNTAESAIGGAVAGGPVGGLAGALSRPPAQPQAVPPQVVPPQAQPAAEKAQEPNSPLSKAAVAGATADAAVQASAPPTPAEPEDPILSRAAQIKAAVQQGGLLEALRMPDSPVNTKQFLNDLAAASSKSTGPAVREQAMERLEFALGWAEQNIASAPKAPGPMLDQLPGVTVGEERPGGPRPTIPQLRAGADRDAALIAQRDGAMTDFERRQAEAQRDVNLQRNMRAAAPEQGAPAASADQAGITDEQQSRLEAASMAGEQLNRRKEDEPRQIVIDRALRNVEERGGVASPQEAQIFAEAGIGRPYDRIDESLGPKPELTIPRMEIAGPVTTESGIILADAGPTQRDPSRAGRLQRVGGLAPATERGERDVRSAMQGGPVTPLPGVVNVNRSGQAGATDQQNELLLSGQEDIGTELARKRIEAGYVAPKDQRGKKSASKSEDRVAGADESYQRVEAPRAVAASGVGPAFLRRRRAMLDQMAASGFETIERRDDGFYLRNARTRQELKLDGAADAQLARAAIKRMVDERAHAAATSPKNDRPEPTPGQIDNADGRSNYKKGDRFQLNGVTVVIENPEGSTRRSKPGAKVEWETKMRHHYGDLAGTKGADGAPVDVFIGPDPSSSKIFVVDQVNEDGSFDEHKVMMGFRSEQDARAGYLANYAPGWRGLGAIREMTQDQLRAWVKDRSATAEPVSSPGDVAADVKPENEIGPTFTVFADSEALTLTRVGESSLPDEEAPERDSKGQARNKISRSGAAMIRALAGVFGKNVVFYANNEAGRKAGDGFIKPNDPSTIYLRESTTISHLAVFGHELMHALRIENPAAYKAIEAVVRKRVKDPKGFRRDYYGDKIAKQRGDAELDARRGGELEELISDLNGNQMRDASFWKEVFDEIAKNEPAAEAKSAIAKLVALVQGLVEKIVAASKGAGFKADRFVVGHKEIRAALRDGLAQYVKQAGITRTSMQAEVLKAGERFGREDRIKRAHTQLKKNGLNDWSATTDLRDEGVPVLLQTRTSGGALITSATEFVDGRETTRNVAASPKMKVDQMSIGNHHKNVVQRYREMAKLAGIRRSVGRVQTETPEDGGWSTVYTRAPSRAAAESVIRLRKNGAKGIKPQPAWRNREFRIVENDGQFDIQVKLRQPRDAGVSRSPERGIHFSKEPRTTLNGGYYGRGLKGSEAQRLAGATDPRLKSRVYFYIDEGNGVRPEAGVGGYAHEVDLPKLYDAKANPDRLWNSGDLNATESAILDAGYDGYFVKKHQTGQGFAVVIGKASGSMPARQIANPNLAAPVTPPAPAAVSRGLMSREIPKIDVLAIPGARMKMGTLTVPAGSVDAANAEMERIGSDIRFSRERLEAAAGEYKAVEEKYKGTPQWMKAPNGNRTKLTERQWVQVRTPAFKSWFGDWERFAADGKSVWYDEKGEVSKVVDENGEPLVVYHGTGEGGFMAFDRPGGSRRGDLGIFTTNDEGMASSYVRRNRTRRVVEPTDEPQAGDQPGIYALFVNIRSAEESHFEGANWDGRRWQWAVEREDGEIVYDDDGRAYFEDRNEAVRLAARESGEVVQAPDHFETTDQVVREARSLRKDGAIIRSVVDDGGGTGYSGQPADIFVAFEPSQLKSADFNDGSYSVDEDDIRRSTEKASIEGTYDNENRVSVVVGGKPGEMGWDFTKLGVKPPPFQAPTSFGPRLDRMGEAVRRILSTKAVASLAEDAFGIKGLRAIPLKGSWLTKPEPSFALVGDEMAYPQAVEFAKMLGFAFAQDATIAYQPTPDGHQDGIPAMYIGSDSRLSPKQFRLAAQASVKAGLDYSTTHDGKGLKFLYFGGNEGYYEFLDNVYDIQQAAGLKESDLFYVRSSLHEANDYVARGDGSGGKAAWLSDSGSGSPGLFRRTVDHLLVPYAKAVGAEGYRFAIQRFGDLFGLDGQQRDLIRDALIPKSGLSKSTVPIASGAESLGLPPGKNSVTSIVYALQNRSAQAGLIEPGDYSDRAMRVIAEAIADEVKHHLENPRAGKSAIGWYDTALKAAKKNYAAIFPELETDRDAEMLFDALWGITSQGNDVFSNSIYGARIYQLVRKGPNQMSIPQAVQALKGSFGGETSAIENNLLKLHELLDRNGYDAMRAFFNTRGTVGELNARLRKDKTLFFGGKRLKIDGQADQVVTGWMVFGPKIGSFINNLHGDYSTLTADLWFTRSWNRILGYGFVHAPALEAAQYQKFISALVTEYNLATSSGVVDPSLLPVDKDGFERGEDAADIDIERVLTNPYYALEVASELEEKFRKGGYKKKSTLRRAAKVWVENRTQTEAAPRTDLERSFQQKTAEMAQKIIRRRTGQKISIADIQAALWFYEKDDLYKPLGGTSKRSEGADYESASQDMLRTYRRGNLFLNKTSKRFVHGSRGSYLDTFDPNSVVDAAAVIREYEKSPIEGATFTLEDDGDDVMILPAKEMEMTPEVARSAVARVVEIARERGIGLAITPKVNRNWNVRREVEAIYQSLGFGEPDAEGVMRMEAASQDDVARSAERNRSELESIFDGLGRRGLARQRAQDALEGRPDAAIIDYVESNFLDILERLEESGRVKINCE